MDEKSKREHKLSGKLEVTANILIIAVAVMLIGFIGQRYFFGSSDARQRLETRHPTIGKKVDLPGVEFTHGQSTVFLVLQTTCRYGIESMSFYERLVRETKDKAVKFIAVFPTKPEDGMKHLSEYGIANIEVRQAPLSSLDAGGTPTIILTDGQGSVTNYWIGKLPPEKESEVIDLISKSEN
jgi:hypothetical protein